jgi:site-specific DNA recombinase
MSSHWVNKAAYYRCRFPEEYALANKVSHPLNVYIREDRVVPRLDKWLASLFEPEHIERTLDTLVAAQRPASGEEVAVAAARREIAEADRKLARHRAALEAGADPAVVAGWIKDVQSAKAEAESRLRLTGPSRTSRLGRDELAMMIGAMGEMVKVLDEADRALKAKIYSSLGLRLTYHPVESRVLISQVSPARTIGGRFVSEGGLEPPCPLRALAPQASASAYSATRTSACPGDARLAASR